MAVWGCITAHGQCAYNFRKNFDDLAEKYREQLTPNSTREIDGALLKGNSEYYYGEILRCWMNFLASAAALIDHTRIVMKRLDGTELAKDYLELIREHFSNDPLCKFVKELRNMILHKGYPPYSLTLICSRTESESVFLMENVGPTIDRDVIDCFGWSPDSRKFISEFDAGIRFQDVAEKYFKKVEELSSWLEKGFANLYNDVCREIQECEAEIKMRS